MKMSPTSVPAIRDAEARRTSPGFRPYSRAFSRLTVTWMCGTSTINSLCRLIEARDVRECRTDLLGLVPQDVEVRAEDADHDRLPRAGQDLANALLQVGLHVAVQAGIALHHLLDLGVASCRSRRPG